MNNQAAKITIVIILVFNFYIFPKLYPQETEHIPHGEILDSLSPELKDAISRFSLKEINPHMFSVRLYFKTFTLAEEKKHYLYAGFQVVAINLVVWTYDVRVLKADWARTSLQSILNNFKYGFEWDDNSFKTNQFEHPFHGAMYFSSARSSGLDFWESIIYPFMGSFMWEFMMENNRPSANDFIMTPLGGITLGEVLYRIAGLINDRNSSGFQKIIQQSVIFVINPVYGFNMITRKGFRRRTPYEKYYYDFNLALGSYNPVFERATVVVVANLEYKDASWKVDSNIYPYSWFSLHLKLGFSNSTPHDKEIRTTGILVGKRGKHSLIGFFSILDYIDNHLSEKISAVGFGPGLKTEYSSKSNVFIHTAGFLSLIFGGSASSLDVYSRHLLDSTRYPYSYGPGVKGKIDVEFGKKGLGSIQSEYSQYWVHSIHTQAEQLLSVLSSYVTFELSRISKISFGYEYNFRHTLFPGSVFINRKGSAVILYTLKL